MMLSLVGDAIVALLLIATIGYAATLNRRLGVLRGDRAKLDELIQGLGSAAQRAEAGIAGLKEAAEDMGRELERKIEVGKRLKDDLAYMAERGGAIADRLEGGLRSRRDEAPPAPERKRDTRPEEPRLEAKIAAAPEPTRGLAPSRAERELLRALAGR